MKYFVVLFFLIFFPIFSWTNHFFGTYLSLKVMPEIAGAKQVKAESFKSFVNKEAEKLEKLLAEIETEAQEKIPNYPARPDSLKFSAADPKDRDIRVLRALRLNPNIKLKLFVQDLPGTKKPGRKLTSTDVSVYEADTIIDSIPLYEVKEGSTVAPIQIIATASDEPDYGHDINIFTDTGTKFGEEYNFGAMPFGNPKYHYSTQAPFHMGFFYESGIIYKLAPAFKRTYPELRVHQFYKLAQFAFSTGHEYWGYRFMGWAMHYLGDLTQPYHSTMSPGNSTAGLLWIEFRSVIGFKGAKQATIERLSDRHTAIEVYQYNVLQDLLRKNELNHPIVTAYQDTSKDENYKTFDILYAREVIAKESNGRAEGLDERIGKSDYVFSYHNYKADRSKFQPDPGSEEVNKYLIELLNSFGSHSRNFSKFILKRTPDKS